jgi:hydroxyethylthiazole kinase-like uncharacterized protein yjeF
MLPLVCLAILLFATNVMRSTPSYTVQEKMALTKKEDLPVLLRDEARTIDLEVTDKIGRVRILESVATRIADLMHYHLLDGSIGEDTPLLFVAGKGNNGANAMACARILHLRGFTNIQLVTLVDPKGDVRPNIREQLDLFAHFVGESNIHAMDWDVIKNHKGIFVDGILGTGISDPPRGVSKEAIEAIQQASTSAQTLSIDIPSGLNHITGVAPGVCIRATWTCNLHMLKSGQLEPVAKEYIGELWSVESALGFITFPEPAKFKAFYKHGPIQKVEVQD